MPLSLLGTILALLLCVLVVALAWLVVRRPALGIGVLVAGMAFHNFMLMVLLRLETPAALVRAVQSWKELLLAVLTAVAAVKIVTAVRQGKRLSLGPADWVVVAFMAVLAVYLFVPSTVLGGHATLLQKLAEFRIFALIPLLYFLGRVFVAGDKDIRTDVWLVVGAGAVVGAFGLVELWLVPTARWLSWGINLYSSWLGFRYNGPAGLPANFFQTLPDGLLLRRMVSTYISPLGVAYTGILIWPLATALLLERRTDRGIRFAAWFAAVLFATGVFFSVTRLAIFMVVAEAFLLGIVFRDRLAWAIAIASAVLAAMVLFVYPLVGPVVDPNLLPGFSREHYLFSAGDPSFQEHIRQLGIDLRLASQHPLGAGLGESVGRFATGPPGQDAPGESAVLGVFIDVGVLGGILYVLLYGLGLFAGWIAYNRSLPRDLGSALPLVAIAGGLALIPVTLTSDVWGDFSVTFLFWFAVGSSVTTAWRPLLLSRTSRAPAASPALGGEIGA